MIELATALAIVKDVTAMILLMMQTATDAQRVILLDRHLTLTKPFYDLIEKLQHHLPGPSDTPVAYNTPMPGLRPVPLAVTKP